MRHKDGIRINKVKENLKIKHLLWSKEKPELPEGTGYKRSPSNITPGAHSSHLFYSTSNNTWIQDANMHKRATYITESGNWSLH